MATLVTGGIGWVPSHIVKAIASTGESIVTFDLMDPDALFAELIADHVDGVVTVSGDVTNVEQLRNACVEHGITSIIHAAAITPRHDRELHEPERIIDVNLGGTVNALTVARELPGFRRFIYLSSCAALGDVSGESTDETTPSQATGLYGVTKHTSERVVSRYRELFELNATSVRLANVYGPMERVTPGYVGATEMRELLRIYASGETIRINSLDGPWLDWTYVTDIADGIRRIWASEALPHDLYSLTCGRLFSIGDVLAALASYAPGFAYEVVDRSSANYVVSGNPPGPVPSNARLRRDLNWVPSTSFDDGMAQYVDWILRHGPQ